MNPKERTSQTTPERKKLVENISERSVGSMKIRTIELTSTGRDGLKVHVTRERLGGS